ncbi:hypothetical protein T552_00588 [Pneumocystis carinii B80]|uniref:Diphthamide biosynthesis protein 4 n=1 Tax=Pneumocystis carinii (strain B80) TaxID=1408658 RepID=A0A0W4ZP10_PNEC8|nr:hypothetical protein T552_00588 [Pneumocystis carinii B80]KTW30110.1 hypothetical protein T552_00588 [Pneumocystis carinii B80]
MSFNLPFSAISCDFTNRYYLKLDSHFCNSRCNALLILGLDPKTSFTNEELREAYRKRLLQVHPDKQYKNSISTELSLKPEFSDEYCLSIDDIRQSFYRLQQELLETLPKESMTSVFYETVYLEDFTYSVCNNEFSLSCRCGDMFILSSQEIQAGEAIVSCNGCSLWIRVISNIIPE